MKKNKILIISGPNLNMLGVREKSVYGDKTLDDIYAGLKSYAEKLNIEAVCLQSNSESAIAELINRAAEDFEGIILNAGAYTHYSERIKTAVSSAGIPCLEVHLSNVFAREKFRHTSVLTDVCVGSVCGFGENSYKLALDALAEVMEV